MSGEPILKRGTMAVRILREASAEPTRMETLRARASERRGTPGTITPGDASHAATTLVKHGLLTRLKRGLYALTRAGEDELDRLFEEAELDAWTATLTPAPAPAPADAARRTA